MKLIIFVIFSSFQHLSAQENICNLSDSGGLVQIRIQDKIIKKYVHICTQDESSIIFSNESAKNRACAVQFFNNNVGPALHGIEPGNIPLRNQLESQGLIRPPAQVEQ